MSHYLCIPNLGFFADIFVFSGKSINYFFIINSKISLLDVTATKIKLKNRANIGGGRVTPRRSNNSQCTIKEIDENN
jgi:hypothetical protein